MTWSPDDVAAISVRWLGGDSAGDIAKDTGRTVGAVAGKLDRLGLLGSPDRVRKSRKRGCGMMWTDEAWTMTEALWNEGKSAAEIAKALRDIGVKMSRNAVIGKVHRKGLSGRATPSKPAKRVHRTQPKRIVQLNLPCQPLPKPRIDPTSIAPLITAANSKDGLSQLHANACRWIYGDPKESPFEVCGRESVAGRPYCEAHCACARATPLQLARMKAVA